MEEDATAANVTRTYELKDVGEAIEMEVANSPEENRRVKMVRLKNAPNCMSAQIVVSPVGSSAAPAFFSSLVLTPTASNASPNQPTAGSVAERLRQLDQLLKDRLISQDEYNKRRLVIINSL